MAGMSTSLLDGRQRAGFPDPPPSAFPQQALQELRDIAAKWEAQAEGAGAQNERLKDLLEESASWGAAAAVAEAAAAAEATSARPGGGEAVSGQRRRQHEQHEQHEQQQDVGEATGGGAVAEAAAPLGGGAAAGAAQLAALCRRLESELLLEKARSARLDGQVRALCAELTRAVAASGQMRASLLPLLGGVEARLAAALAVRPPPAAMQGITAAQ